MTASCSDFTSDVQQAMYDANLLREDDVPSDNVDRQTGLALDVLKRLVDIKDLAATLAALVQSGAAYDEAVAAAKAVITSIKTLVPRWLVCEEYGHCFVGSKETRTRWAVDLETGKMVYAQSFGDTRWSDLHRDEIADLREDVMDVNEVRLNPEDFGAVLRDLPPTWALDESVEPVPA